jgi:hypothetical protein
LEAYIALLEEWVEAVRAGEPIDELMPIYHRHSLAPVPPTLRFAEMIALRIRLLQDLLDSLLKKSIIEHHIGITVHLERGVRVRVGS